jgi:hypothetical protein
MKLFIKDLIRVEMLSEYQICKLICIGCHNKTNFFLTPLTSKGVKRGLVLSMVLKANLETSSPPLPISTPSTITLNANHNNVMLNFGVWSSIFGT